MARAFLLTTILVGLRATTVVAATPEAGSPTANDAGTLEVPTSPAFDALGATPSSVLRPSSIRQLGADLRTSVGATGLKPGFAIEAAPLWLWLGEKVTLQRWRQDRSARALSRLGVSMATQSLDNHRMALAEGVRFAIWDDSDPRWDIELERCLKEVARATLTQEAPEDPMGAASGFPTLVAAPAAAAQCREQNAARARKKDDLQMAVATATVQQTDPGGKSVTVKALDGWFSASYATGGSQVFIASLRASRDIALNVNTVSLGVRAQVGRVQTTLSLDASAGLDSSHPGSSAAHGSLAAVFEQRIAESMWVSINGGGRLGDMTVTGERLFVIVSLKVDSNAFPLFTKRLW